MSGDRADGNVDADLRRYERRMRAQLANVITVQTGSLADVPSLDSLTDAGRKRVERGRWTPTAQGSSTPTSCTSTTALAGRPDNFPQQWATLLPR